MSRIRYSVLAARDLSTIAQYTLDEWGESRMHSYLADLEACCKSLSLNPALGRICNEIRPGLRRHECGKHVIFYRKSRQGVSIIRVLHQRMLPGSRFQND